MKHYLILVCLVAFFVMGCVPMDAPNQGHLIPDPIELPDPPDPAKFAHTSLLYMVSPSLSMSLTGNVNDLRHGDVIAADHAVLVYIDTGTSVELKRVRTGADGMLKLRNIMTFPNTDVSTTKDRIDFVWQYVQENYPATTYGMVLSGHGNGWEPYRMTPTKSIFTEPAIDAELTIASLAQILPPYHLDYLVLDACHMGSIEVCYELKDVCTYIMASATEIWGSGYVYDSFAETLFPYSGVSSVEAYAQAYYDKYKTPNSSSGGATVAVIRTAELEPLADAFKALYLSSSCNVADVSTENMQHYDREALPSNITMYELKQFASKLEPSTETYTNFVNQLDKAVPFKKASSKFGDNSRGWIDIDPQWYSGLYCYVPNNMYSVLQAYYAETAWNLKVGLVNIE